MMERQAGSRLMVYDRTCGGPWGLPGLTFLMARGGPDTITCLHGRVPPGF